MPGSVGEKGTSGHLQNKGYAVRRTGKQRGEGPETGRYPWLVREERKVYEAREDGSLARKRRRFKLIDVFGGAGGMTLGFSKAFGHAFDSIWANDFDGSCVSTYNANFGDHSEPGDIVSILEDARVTIPQADVVIGGPPCQGFSLLNKKREGDPRCQLWRQYLKVVERSDAKVFVMENVPQLLGSSEYHQIVATAEATMGFKVCGGILCAADYGVPQTRRRAIIVGSRFFDPSQVFPPYKTHYAPRKGDGQYAEAA